MKMVSGEIEVETPVVVYDYATSRMTGVGEIPIGQALAALGEPNSPSELAQRLAVAVSMLWPEVADADLFLPEKGRPLRGVRDARAGAELLASLQRRVGPHRGARPDARDADAAARRRRRRPRLDDVDARVLGQVARRLPRRAAPPGGRRLHVYRSRGARCAGRGRGHHPARDARAPSASGAAWLEQDLSAARDLQRTFLPEPIAKNSAGIRVVTEYMPAHAVGGDFYDFIDLGGGRVMGVIGDVSGKGVTAALTMARVSADVRRFATEVGGPAELLERLNNTLTARLADHRFVTALAVLLDLPNRRWVFANAGHVLPLLRRSTGVVSRVAYSSGPPLGIMAHAQYQEEVVSVASKDILLLATDGVFEILSAPRRPCSTMGQCQLTDLVTSAPHDIGEIDKRIVATAEAAAASGRDDLTLLGMQVGA